MPASTTAKKPTPAPTNPIAFADAMERARARIATEFDQSSYKEISDLIAKLMIRYTQEELKK